LRGAQGLRSLRRSRKYQKETIAVAGLTASHISHMRSAEGEVMWGSMELLKKNFPVARFISATPLLGTARYRKSAAEIEHIRKGVRIAELELEALRRHAKVGVSAGSFSSTTTIPDSAV
jgi:Xaa-Pro aminopeptidase